MYFALKEHWDPVMTAFQLQTYHQESGSGVGVGVVVVGSPHEKLIALAQRYFPVRRKDQVVVDGVTLHEATVFTRQT